MCSYWSGLLFIVTNDKLTLLLFRDAGNIPFWLLQELFFRHQRLYPDQFKWVFRMTWSSWTLVPCNQHFTSQSLVIVRILPQDVTNILAWYPDPVSWSCILIRYPDHIQLIKNQDTKSGYGLRISPMTIVPKNITVGYHDSNEYIFFSHSNMSGKDICFKYSCIDLVTSEYYHVVKLELLPFTQIPSRTLLLLI